MTRAFASIHRKNGLMLALAAGVAIPYGWAAVWSVALGGAIQVVNLRALDRAVSSLRDLGRSGRPSRLRLLLAMRFVIVVVIVGFVLLRLPVDPLAFVIGLGTVVPAALWHGLDSARRLRAEEP